MRVKTWEEFCSEVAKAHKLGNTLVTGHRASYFKEAAEEYAKQEAIQFFNALRQYYLENGYSAEEERTSEEFYQIFKDNQ